MSTMGDKSVNKRSDKKATTKESGSDDRWIGFVDVELTTEQKADCKRHLPLFEQAWKDLHDLIAEGYKLSVSYDDPHTTWNVALTGREGAGKNKGYTLTGRGGSEAAAYVSLWYKHTIVLKGDWTTKASSNPFRLGADDFA